MRKIQTPEELERKRKRNKAIIGVILVALLLFSTAGFALNGIGSGSSNPDTSINGEEQDGFGGNFNGQYWVYTKDNQEFYFNNIPEVAGKVEVTIENMLEDYSGRVLYLDSSNQQALNNLGINLNRYVGRIQPACYGECEENLPEITCNEENNLIVFRESEENRVYQEGSCVFIEGNLVSVDAFLYKILGFN